MIKIVENDLRFHSTMVYFTLADYVDAIEKNGLPQYFGNYYSRGIGGKVVAACALGQGRLNLHMTSPNAVNRSSDSATLNNFQTRVADLNDKKHLPLKEIAQKVRIEFAAHMGINLRGYYVDEAIA